MGSDEATLVRQCLGGDPKAVAALVARFQADLFGLCIRLLRHRHDAEDVCQEVFLRIFRGLGHWDSSRPLKPWILGIAVNRCRTWLAQRRRRPDLVDYLQDVAMAPEKGLESREMAAEIARAVDGLRPEYREVFILFHEQGQGYEVIAEVLDRPVGTIKTWLHRARLLVLQQLREKGMVGEEPAPHEEAPERVSP